MSARVRATVFTAMLGVTAIVSSLYVRNAEAFWPLSYAWECAPESATQEYCGFVVTNQTPPSGYHYQWFFGDGSQTARLPSTSDYEVHYYAVPVTQSGSFTVTLVGWSSATSSSPDNFISCSISFTNGYGPGGAPPYGGVCQ